MKREEVIKDYITSLTYAIAEDESNGPRVQRKEIIREALIKQVPLKVDNSLTDDESNALCPACRESLWDNATYCEECGQRLNWEEE